MHSSNFVKLSGVILVVVLLALGGLHSSTLAGPLAQATMTATSAAGGGSTPAMIETAGGAMTFPPCPPAAGATAAVGAGAAPASTLSATMAATAGAANPGYLGVRVEQVANCGARILEVVAGSPAQQAGLMVGDVIVGMDGRAISGVDDARRAVESLAPGSQIRVTVQRAGTEQTIVATLAARPTTAPATAATGASGTLPSTPAATADR